MTPHKRVHARKRERSPRIGGEGMGSLSEEGALGCCAGSLAQVHAEAPEGGAARRRRVKCSWGEIAHVKQGGPAIFSSRGVTAGGVLEVAGKDCGRRPLRGILRRTVKAAGRSLPQKS
jgi:hypothetical protein